MPTLKAISVQLDRVAAMQRACAGVLPAALSTHVRAAYLDKKVLVFEASSGAVAAKVRYLSARLTTTLRRAYPELEGVRVEVVIPRRTTLPAGNKRRIRPTGKRALEALAGSLPGGELKAAVERLLTGQASSDSEDEAFQDQEDQRHRGDQ
jgi:hypothetical protein